jgi:hypothetical protein
MITPRLNPANANAPFAPNPGAVQTISPPGYTQLPIDIITKITVRIYDQVGLLKMATAPMSFRRIHLMVRLLRGPQRQVNSRCIGHLAASAAGEAGIAAAAGETLALKQIQVAVRQSGNHDRCAKNYLPRLVKSGDAF